MTTARTATKHFVIIQWRPRCNNVLSHAKICVALSLKLTRTCPLSTETKYGPPRKEKTTHIPKVGHQADVCWFCRPMRRGGGTAPHYFKNSNSQSGSSTSGLRKSMFSSSTGVPAREVRTSET